MSKGPGPTPEQRARGIAMVMAQAIGKMSDEKWREGPWFMALTCASRAFADMLVAGAMDATIADILRHRMPWNGGTHVGPLPATWASQPPSVSDVPEQKPAYLYIEVPDPEDHDAVEGYIDACWDALRRRP